MGKQFQNHGWNTRQACLAVIAVPQAAARPLNTKSGRDIDKDKETGLTVMFDQEAPYYAEAKLVFICKKMSKQKMEPSSFIDSTIDETFYKEKDYHEVFVGDIVTILKQD